MIKLQAKKHANFNGYNSATGKTAKNNFTQNPQIDVYSSSINFKGVRSAKNISKLKKFAAKIFGHTVEAECDDGLFRRTKFNRHGIKVQEQKFFPGDEKAILLKYEKDGTTLKKKIIQEYNALEQWVLTKRIEYKKGRLDFQYTLNPNKTYEKIYAFEDGTALLEKGEVLSSHKHVKKEKSWIEAPKTPQKMQKGHIPTDGIIIKIQAKDFGKFKARFDKAMALKDPTRRHIMIVENPNFETFKKSVEQLPKKSWLPQALSKRGFNVTYPKGDSDSDIINICILKSKNVIDEYNNRFTGKGGQKMAKIYKNESYKILKEFWTEVANKTQELESMTYKPANPKTDKDYISQAEFLRLAATNEQDIDCFNALLGKFKIKTFDYKPKKKATTK